MHKALFCIALCCGTIGAAAPQLPPRPPNGTYTYELRANGKAFFTSTIVVSTAGKDVLVAESATLPPDKQVLVTRTYDAATMLPVRYDLRQRAMGSNTNLTASVNASSARFTGMPLAFNALPNTHFVVLGEGLAAYRIMLPTVALANGERDFTFGALNGNMTMAGTVIAADEPRPAGVPGGDRAMAFRIGSDTLTVWYDPQTLITHEADSNGGISVRLAQYSAVTTALAAPPQILALPLPSAHYLDRTVTVNSGGAMLSGVLSIPGHAKRYPAVLLVHGSGPGTRNGGTQANPTFLQLANTLANAGIAVLRYDKRGIAQSSGKATEDWHVLGRDVTAMVAFLRKQPQIDPSRIFVLGHSEGGFIVPELANSLPVRGIIVLAAPAIPMEDILKKQGVGTMPPAQQKAFADAFRSYIGIDPARVFASVKRPMLLIQGGKDSQVLASDFHHIVDAAKSAHRNVKAILLPEDDHLFIRLPASQASEGDEIFQPHMLDPRVSAAILDWIGALR